MPLVHSNLGYVLQHIYDYPFWTCIYLQQAEDFKADTAVIVSLFEETKEEEELHRECLRKGFGNWLNVAVVSDTCDGVTSHTQDNLVAAFNADCQEAGWLAKMMNYRNE